MSTSKQVVINVAPDGSVSVDAQGFKGKGCTAATEQIEIAIGGVGGNKKKKDKPEMFAPPSGSSTTNKLKF